MMGCDYEPAVVAVRLLHGTGGSFTFIFAVAWYDPPFRGVSQRTPLFCQTLTLTAYKKPSFLPPTLNFIPALSNS